MLVQQALVCLIICAVRVLGQEHIQLTLNEETTELQVVGCGEYKYYKVDVTDPCRDLRVRVNHIEGEPDLYVGRGKNKFPKLSSLAWTSYQWGSEDLTISSWDPEFNAGTFYIGVHAYCGDDVSTDQTPSKYTLLAESVESAHPHTEITVSRPITNDVVDAEAYNYYRFCLPRRCTDVSLTLSNCRDSLSCPTSYSYPELLVTTSIVKPEISDHSWKLASGERVSIDLRYNDPDVKLGHYFVGLYGWCTPDAVCHDKSTCGPCEYVPNVRYNLSLVMTEVEGCDPIACTDDCDVSDNMPTFLPSAITIALSSLIMVLLI